MSSMSQVVSISITYLFNALSLLLLVTPGSVCKTCVCLRARVLSSSVFKTRHPRQLAHEFASVGQYAAFTAFIEPGDEVIIFEPFFDQYLPSIAFQGGKCVYVPLHPSSEPAPGSKVGKQTWTLDLDELRCAPSS